MSDSEGGCGFVAMGCLVVLKYFEDLGRVLRVYGRVHRAARLIDVRHQERHRAIAKFHLFLGMYLRELIREICLMGMRQQ